MAGKKISTADLSGNVDVFGDLIAPSTSVKQTAPAVEEKEVDNPVHLTMIVKESTRKNWKTFFIEHGLNTTQGIEIAVLHLMAEVEAGKYRLSKGGLVEVPQSAE